MRAVSHLPVKLFLACLLAVAMLATLTPLPLFAAESVAVTIAPGRAGDTAVRYSSESGDARIAVTGTVPADAQLTEARLVALDAAGNEVGRQVVQLGNNPAPDDYLYNDGGQLKGAISPLCEFFGSPEVGGAGCAGPSTEVRDAVLVFKAGGADVASNAIRIDYRRPYIRGYEVIASNKIRVSFSEPVRGAVSEAVQREGWYVDDVRSVVDITRGASSDCAYADGEDVRAGTSGCTRILTLGTALDQDATPRVAIRPANLVEPYEDFASNDVLFTTQYNANNKADSNAADLIRPLAPHIQSVDGKTGGTNTRIVSNTASPEARITNLTGGHRVELTVQRPSGSAVTLTETVPAGATRLDVTIPASQDGQYTLTAVAVDPSGNRSDDTTKSAPTGLAKDGARPTAEYVLDTVAPQVLTADLRNRRTVDVRFTEPVRPADDAGDWFVGDVPVTAVGSGATRTLNASIDLTNPGAVRWEPSSAEAGSVGRYGDEAGNGMATVTGIALDDLPPVQAPGVRSPSRVVYTRAAGFRITGTGPARDGLAVDLFERGGVKALRSAPLTDGVWSLDQALENDGRYSYAVQLRDTATGATSPRIPVPDIVRDTAAPKVTVSAPVEPTTPAPLGGPQEYGVGDVVTIRWTATDTADDPQRPDHGRSATIFLVDEADGSRQAIKTGIQHQPGQEQTANYTLKAADLAGQGVRDLHFDVAVDDLAANIGQSSSGTIRLLDSLIGYRAVLTSLTVGSSSSVIEARFPVELQGATVAADWRVDGQPPAAAQKSASGRVVTLTVPLSDDPNATHTVTYQPNPVNLTPLEDANRRQVSGAPRDTRDRIIPRLEAKAPSTRRVVDRSTVVFSGTTDETSTANTIAAFRADRRGGRVGPAVATKRAAKDGTWSMRVPLDPNRRNRIVVQAVDPSGNRSDLSPLYSVIEDSKRPVVRMLSPDNGDTLRAVKRIRWRTSEANKQSVAIRYKKRNASTWRTVTSNTRDDGIYRWELPKRKLRGAIFNLRVRATDATGKRDAATARGLRADFRR